MLDLTMIRLFFTSFLFSLISPAPSDIERIAISQNTHEEIPMGREMTVRTRVQNECFHAMNHLDLRLS